MALKRSEIRSAKRNWWYWKLREEEQLKRYLTEEKEYDRYIRQIYLDMLDACQKEIDSFYARYAKAEGITLAEAKRRVRKLDIEAYERKAKRYVKNKTFTKKANEEMRLYNATMRINRLEMLKASIGLELIAGHDELDKFMAEILQGRTEAELVRQAGILGKSVLNNTKKAHAIVNASFHNATFSDRIWNNQDQLRSEIGRLLQSGLIQGKNPRALARDLRKTFDVSILNSERLMRTELARVQTEAQKQSFQRNGFEEYEFICNHKDGKTCDLCLGMDGKHFKVEDMVPGENAPPLHPNCRCSTAVWEDSAEYEAWLDFLEAGGTTEEWNSRKKAGKPVANSGKSGTMDDKKIGTQFFANKSIAKQNDRQLQKSIVSWKKNVAEHEDKINNPANYDSDWDSKTETWKAGLIKHWKKEIVYFKENIKEAEAELEKRRREE